MKLFSNENMIATESLDKLIGSKEETIDTLDKDFTSLENHVNAYVSVGIVHEAVAEESFNFLDKKNYVLFNEYIKTITKDLGLKSVPVVSTEAITELPGLVVNHDLALEGFLGSLWDKVKTLFKKIYESVKAFFTKHFTRMGRLKKKLENLKEVLKETDKDIKQLNLDKVPGPISKAFPFEGVITEDTVKTSLDIVKGVINVLSVTNKDAVALAGKDVLDRDFVAKVKALKDQVSANKDKIDENNSNKTGGLKSLYGEGKANNKQLKEDNKTLSQINKEKSSEIASKEGELKATVSSKENIEAMLEDKSFEVAKREMSAYYTEVAKAFKAIEGKPIPGGKMLKEAKITEDGIELNFDENKDEPNSVSLGSKNSLTGLVDTMLSSLDELEKATNGYSKVNDAIMKNMDTVDSLMKDLDKVTDNPNYQAYKSVLEKKVRERLKYMQKFFTEYNKISKNLIEVVASVGDGVVAYGVSSLKHFG